MDLDFDLARGGMTERWGGGNKFWKNISLPHVSVL